jgi:hypothetical protein
MDLRQKSLSTEYGMQDAISKIILLLLTILLMCQRVSPAPLVNCRARLANNSQLFFSNAKCKDIGTNQVSCGNSSLLKMSNFTQNWIHRLKSGWTLWYTRRSEIDVFMFLDSLIHVGWFKFAHQVLRHKPFAMSEYQQVRKHYHARYSRHLNDLDDGEMVR